MGKEKKPAEPDKPQDDTEKPVAVEVGGRKGPDPTRYRDYEVKGKCVDF